MSKAWGGSRYHRAGGCGCCQVPAGGVSWLGWRGLPFSGQVKLCWLHWMAFGCFVVAARCGNRFRLSIIVAFVDGCCVCFFCFFFTADLWGGGEPAGQVEGLAQHPRQPWQHRTEGNGPDRSPYNHGIHPAAALAGQLHQDSCTVASLQKIN